MPVIRDWVWAAVQEVLVVLGFANLLNMLPANVLQLLRTMEHQELQGTLVIMAFMGCRRMAHIVLDFISPQPDL